MVGYGIEFCDIAVCHALMSHVFEITGCRNTLPAGCDVMRNPLRGLGQGAWGLPSHTRVMLAPKRSGGGGVPGMLIQRSS